PAPGLALTARGERNVGPARVLTGARPGGLAVPRQVDLGKCCHLDSSLTPVCSILRRPAQICLRSRDHAVRPEPELPLELLERRQRPKRVHADALTCGAHIALPAVCRGLLHRDTCLHLGWQHTVPVHLRLVLEDIPG